MSRKALYFSLSSAVMFTPIPTHPKRTKKNTRAHTQTPITPTSMKAKKQKTKWKKIETTKHDFFCCKIIRKVIWIIFNSFFGSLAGTWKAQGRTWSNANCRKSLKGACNFILPRCPIYNTNGGVIYLWSAALVNLLLPLSCKRLKLRPCFMYNMYIYCWKAKYTTCLRFEINFLEAIEFHWLFREENFDAVT